MRLELQHDLFRPTDHCALLQLYDVISSHKHLTGLVKLYITEQEDSIIQNNNRESLHGGENWPARRKELRKEESRDKARNGEMKDELGKLHIEGRLKIKQLN